MALYPSTRWCFQYLSMELLACWNFFYFCLFAHFLNASWLWIFFYIVKVLFSERLHYTRKVLTFILNGSLQRNGHMVEKHLTGWLVRTTINLFLLSLMAELKQILQLKNSCIFAKLPHFWPLTLIAFSNYGTSLVNLYLKSPSAVSTSSKTFCNKLWQPFCKLGYLYDRRIPSLIARTLYSFWYLYMLI